jgi:hypothetical protein
MAMPKSNFDALFGFYLFKSLGALPIFRQSDPSVEINCQLRDLSSNAGSLFFEKF